MNYELANTKVCGLIRVMFYLFVWLQRGSRTDDQRLSGGRRKIWRCTDRFLAALVPGFIQRQQNLAAQGLVNLK